MARVAKSGEPNSGVALTIPGMLVGEFREDELFNISKGKGKIAMAVDDRRFSDFFFLSFFIFICLFTYLDSVRNSE